ncbi:LacI family DNA-binding transcriptional regulator [Streptomyces sp. NPDC092296]|uniref:LacI family DNA-binding transcriptional regulator n=1 Tax=Streptomyces sp. NPDC092296 TaxID=3366012 RepID=UPI00380FC80C
MGRPRSSKVTVRDIAAAAGVSIATVSRVMNGRTAVSAETREAVQSAIERLGAPQARGRTSGRPGRDVFVRCPYLLTDYFGIIVSAVAETLELYGRQVILNAGDAVLDSDVLTGLPDRAQLGGAILIIPPEPAHSLETLSRRDFPFVVVDPRTPLPRDIAAVSAAHFSGARSVTAHLVGLGHRRIGMIGGPGEWLASRSRLAGHASALSEVGVLPSPELCSSVEPTADWGYSAAARLLDLPQRPTALIAFNDKAAVGALRAAYDRGLRVPEELSIAGFDDVYLSSSTVPMLTTVRQPLGELGRMAVSLLMRLMEGHAVETLHVELATELIVRGSTGPVPPARRSG